MARMNTDRISERKKNKLKKPIHKMKQEKMNYEAPMVEIIEVEVEQGFAVSGQGTDTNNDYDFGERF